MALKVNRRRPRHDTRTTADMPHEQQQHYCRDVKRRKKKPALVFTRAGGVSAGLN